VVGMWLAPIVFIGSHCTGDGFCVFLEEVQGTATLRVGGAKSRDEQTISIPIDQVVSLEKTK
jgi:hypothetical protein